MLIALMSHLKTLQWKKNRKFSDIHGGRKQLKLSDNILYRFHSLKKPAEHDELPILLEDNPSRDFFHPISALEASEAISHLPNNNGEGITHIWCRRLKQSEYDRRERNLAEYICGSGVRLVILYAWPKNMELTWERKPQQKFVSELHRLGIKLHRRKSGFYIKPTKDQLRHFYIQSLLFHEIGHHVDWYNRRWSRANVKETEEFADQYAMQMTNVATKVLSKFEKEAF